MDTFSRTTHMNIEHVGCMLFVDYMFYLCLFEFRDIFCVQNN